MFHILCASTLVHVHEYTEDNLVAVLTLNSENLLHRYSRQVLTIEIHVLQEQWENNAKIDIHKEE